MAPMARIELRVFNGRNQGLTQFRVESITLIGAIEGNPQDTAGPGDF